MNALWLSAATFLSTLIGGVLALWLRERLYVVLSFTAGVLIGVVSFDILPEIFALAAAHRLAVEGAMIALVAGFLLFHTLEKFVLVHHAHESDYAVHRHPQVGLLSAVALIGHSFMDGVGIGLGFQVSTQVGVVVAIAVIAHDFCDGMNTVSLMLLHENPARRSLAMLIADALAPVAGAAATLRLEVPPAVLALYLGLFAGFLIYIAASDILPQAHSGHRAGVTAALIGLTCLGAAFVFVVVQALG